MNFHCRVCEDMRALAILATTPLHRQSSPPPSHSATKWTKPIGACIVLAGEFDRFVWNSHFSPNGMPNGVHSVDGLLFSIECLLCSLIKLIIGIALLKCSCAKLPSNAIFSRLLFFCLFDLLFRYLVIFSHSVHLTFSFHSFVYFLISNRTLCPLAFFDFFGHFPEPIQRRNNCWKLFLCSISSVHSIRICFRVKHSRAVWMQLQSRTLLINIDQMSIFLVSGPYCYSCCCLRVCLTIHISFSFILSFLFVLHSI